MLWSACPLQCLVIKGLRVSDQDLLCCLEVVSSLTELHISFQGTTNQTICNLQPLLWVKSHYSQISKLSPSHFLMFMLISCSCITLCLHGTELNRYLTGDVVLPRSSLLRLIVVVLHETYESGHSLLHELIAEGMEITVMDVVDTTMRWL